jgi:hypothetical protein
MSSTDTAIDKGRPKHIKDGTECLPEERMISKALPLEHSQMTLQIDLKWLTDKPRK